MPGLRTAPFLVSFTSAPLTPSATTAAGQQHKINNSTLSTKRTPENTNTNTKQTPTSTNSASADVGQSPFFGLMVNAAS